MTFDPVHDAHAIDKASFVLTLAAPLLPDAWTDVLARTIAIGKGTEFAQAIEGVAAAVAIQNQGTGHLPAVITHMFSAGIGFKQLADDDLPLFEFMVQRNEVRIDFHAYVRWSGFRALIFDVLSPILAVMPSNSEFAQIKLEYWDRFVGSSSTAAWSDVINSKSDLAGWGATRPTNWHAHLGWFDDEHAEQVLVNLNIDAVDEAIEGELKRRAIRVYTLTATTKPLGNVAGVHAALENKLDILHHASKRAVGKVLSQNMTDRISLFPHEEA